MEPEDDELLVALDEVEAEVAEAEATLRETKQRARFLRRERRRGHDARHLLQHEPRPRSVDLLTTAGSRLRSASARLRRSKMQALREEGATISEIAQIFGVTHQRVSTLLRQPATADD